MVRWNRLLPVACWLLVLPVLRAQDPEFRIAEPGYKYEFPRDHGAHPDFRIEWWYITGHLEADPGSRRFGFQATFFRVGQRPEPARPAAFGRDEFHLAHMALYDAKTGRFLHEERINRNGWDAHARVGDLDLRNGNWTLVRTGPGERMRLHGGVRGEAAFTLDLLPAKDKVIFGENGVSRKGADPAAASLYITFPRLAIDGTLRLGKEELKVRGQAWMDHEISSSQLTANQVGWDWASVQFADGREMMVYILRDEAGRPDPFSRLVWIGRDGSLTHLPPDRFTWNPGRTWTSPRTGAEYPIDITITTTDPVTKRPFSVRLRPLADHQELVGHLGGVSYWEGTCDALDADGRPIGKAFVELTGYAGTLQPMLKLKRFHLACLFPVLVTPLAAQPPGVSRAPEVILSVDSEAYLIDDASWAGMEFGADLKYRLGWQHVVKPGAALRLERFDLDADGFPSPDQAMLGEVGVTYLHFRESGWGYFARGEVTAGSEDSLDPEDDHGFLTLLAASKQTRPDTKFGLGLVVKRDVEENWRVFPLPVLQFPLGRRLRLRGEKGLAMDWLEEGSPVRLTFGLNYNNSRFRLEDRRVLEVNAGVAYLQLGYEPRDSFSANARIGASVWGELELDDARGRGIRNEDLDPGPYLSLNLAWTL